MMARVVYVSYTGLLEPLGRSQVLAYLTRLAPYHEITVISFEKPEDLKDDAALAALRQECAQAGIRWLPRRYHQHPRIPATALDMAAMVWDVWRHSKARRADMVHCRSYLPAMAAWLSSVFTRAPFAFDMRALWLEEKITAGRLRRGSVLHRGLRLAERQLLSKAATVVSLTDAAVRHLRTENRQLEQQRFVVIPTCVDLKRFSPENTPRQPGETRNALVMGSVGSIASGWFPLQWLVGAFQHLVALRPDSKLQVVTRDDPSELLTMARNAGISDQAIQTWASKPEDVPAALAGMDFGVVFSEPSLGRLGSLPTRMGEFLASGIPVLGNRGVGDVAELIERYRVGAVVDNDSDTALAQGIRETLDLLAEPDIASRCRGAAEEYFSADRGAAIYDEMYSKAAGASGAVREHQKTAFR